MPVFCECEIDSAHTPGQTSATTESTLSTLLHLIQGAHMPCLADAGLSRLDGPRLQQVHRLAAEQAEGCLDRQEVLGLMLEEVLGSAEPAEQVLLLRAVQQLRCAQQDYRRWLALADNACYYRDSPVARARVARCLPSANA